MVQVPMHKEHCSLKSIGRLSLIAPISPIPIIYISRICRPLLRCEDRYPGGKKPPGILPCRTLLRYADQHPQGRQGI